MEKDRITIYQLWTAVLAIFVVEGLHTYPRSAATLTSTAAPWATLAAGAVALLLFLPVVTAIARRPGTDLIDLAAEAGGRPLAILTALAMGAFMISEAGTSLRQISEMAVTSLYPNSPQTFAMTSLVITATLGAAIRPQGLVWIGSLLVWPGVIIVTLVLIGNMTWGTVRSILPVTGHGVLATSQQILPMTSYYGALNAMLILVRYLSGTGGLVRGAAKAAGVGTLLLAAITLVTLVVFPLPAGINVPFPLFEMTRLAQSGRFFERIDALWILIWVVGAAGRMAMAMMVTALMVKGAFRLPDHRLAILPLAVTTLTVALFPSNQMRALSDELYALRYWGFLIWFILPLGIALIAAVRQGSGRVGAGQGGDGRA